MSVGRRAESVQQLCHRFVSFLRALTFVWQIFCDFTSVTKTVVRGSSVQTPSELQISLVPRELEHGAIMQQFGLKSRLSQVVRSANKTRLLDSLMAARSHLYTWRRLQRLKRYLAYDRPPVGFLASAFSSFFELFLQRLFFRVCSGVLQMLFHETSFSPPAVA